MDLSPGWIELDLADPEPDRVLASFEAASRDLPRRMFQLPQGFGLYDVQNRDDFAFESRWSFQGSHWIAFVGEPLVTALTGPLPKLLGRLIEIDKQG